MWIQLGIPQAMYCWKWQDVGKKNTNAACSSVVLLTPFCPEHQLVLAGGSLLRKWAALAPFGLVWEFLLLSVTHLTIAEAVELCSPSCFTFLRMEPEVLFVLITDGFVSILMLSLYSELLFFPTYFTRRTVSCY